MTDKYATEKIDLKEIPCLPLQLHPGINKPVRAYVDRKRGWVVQVFKTLTVDGTPWEQSLRVAVRRSTAKRIEDYDKPRYCPPITWDQLQQIKDTLWPERIAIEIYPPKDSVVNVAPVRWLWVLPPGAELPFNLQDIHGTLKSGCSESEAN